MNSTREKKSVNRIVEELFLLEPDPVLELSGDDVKNLKIFMKEIINRCERVQDMLECTEK
jgi:hypothetical protein